MISTLGLSTAVVFVVMALTTTGDGVDAFIPDEETDRFDVVGTTQYAWTGAAPTTAATGNSVGSGPESDPPCPVGRWVHGEFYIDTAACGGEFGGTEWVLLLAEDEETDVEAEVAPSQQIAVTRRDVESLLVHAGSLEVQPDRGWVLVNIETIVMTDAVEHVLATEVLGMDVEVRVTPVSFAWDFGDGSPPLVGTDPGAPWPHHTVWHVYQDAGQVTIGLRTEWDAAFRVEGMTGWLRPPEVGEGLAL